LDGEEEIMRKYHHLGIPTATARPGEYYLAEFKVHIVDYADNPYGIEWIHYEPGSPVPELVRAVPHIAFEVKGRAFAAEVDPRAKPGALTRDVDTRLSAAEALARGLFISTGEYCGNGTPGKAGAPTAADPQTKPGAPAAAPAAVDDLEAELAGQEILIPPNSSSPDVTVAFIVHNGAPIEFLHYDKRTRF
jgi:hypothetical protein